MASNKVADQRHLMDRIQSKPADEQFADTSRRQQCFDSVRDGLFIIRWFHIHSLINFFRSMCRPIGKSDMFNITQDLYPQTNVRRYRNEKSSAPNMSLSGLIFKKVILWEFLLGGLLAMIAAGLAFAGPLVIKQIMNYLKIKNPNNAQTTSAYNFAGLWIGLYLLRIFVNQYSERLMFMQAIKTEEVLIIELLEKITKLSPTYRAKLEKGELFNYLSTDVKYVFGFVRSCGVLFAAPATLIAVQAFLFKEVGLQAFALLVILIIVACIQVFLNRKMSSTRSKKLETLNKRMNFNLEVFGSIQQVKILGWESVIINKNRQFRQQQNTQNRRYYTFASIYDLVINMTPPLVVLVIFILQLLVDSSKQVDSTKVYTVLSFAGMTYSPTKSLLNTIISSLDGTAALKRIERFFRADEVDEFSNQDKSLKEGVILVKDSYLGTWQAKQERFSNQDLSSNDLFDKQATEVMSPTKLKAQQSLKQTSDIMLPPRRGQSMRYVLNIPNHLTIHPGEKYIIMGESDGGKSSLLHAIMGNLTKIAGGIKYGGKVGYMPQKLWFQRLSVRQNILFGLPEDPRKLRNIYRLTMLQNQLPLLLKGDQTVIKDLSNITDSQKRRIALARVLYSQPDILLLDSAFASIDPETASKIYENLCREYKHKTILVTSHVTDFLKPQDNIILMRKGRLAQVGKYQTLLANKDSYLHTLREQHQEEEVNEEDLKQRQIQRDQWIARQRKLDVRNRKLRVFIKELLSLTSSLTRGQIEQKLLKPAIETKKTQTAIQAAAQPKRIDGVSISLYMAFFRSASVLLYVLLCKSYPNIVALSLLAQGDKVFADWWVGSLKSLPWSMSSIDALVGYIGLTIGFGLFFGAVGFISPFISVINTEWLSNKICQALSLTHLSWFEGQNTIKVAARLNRDNEQIFNINSQIQNIFRSIILFGATVILVGVNAPKFFILAVAIIILDVIILLFFMREQRELYSYGAEFTDVVNYTFQEVIQGTDTLRAFGKLQKCRERIYKNVYAMQVQKVNMRFISHGVSILTELTSLGIIAGAAFFAVASNNQDVSKQELAIIGTSISFSLKLTGTMVSIIKDCISLQLGMKVVMQKAYQIIGKNQQINYDQPQPPKDWPKNNSIQFDHVTLKHDGFEDPVLIDATFDIGSGENVVVCGKGGKSSILYGMCKKLQPVANSDGQKGRVLIGQVDIQSIGRKFVTEKVMMVTEVPFLFTGTIRENMDPNGLKTDQQIQKCLEQMRIWDFIELNEETEKQLIKQPDETKALLSHTLIDAGSEYSLGIQQRLSLTRALLFKPNVLLCQSCTSSLDQKTEEQVEDLIRSSLKQTTILYITRQIDTTVESDKVIYMNQGRVKEIGTPIELLHNPKSRFSSMVQKTNPELHQRLKTQMKKVKNNRIKLRASKNQ